MQVEARTEVSAAQFFDYLVQMHQQAAASSSGKKITREQILAGVTYDCVATFGKDRRSIQIVVGPVLENRYFEVHYRTHTETVKYYYDLSAIDAGHCRVVYSETHAPLKEKKAGIFSGMQARYDDVQAAVAAQKAISNIEKEIKKAKRSAN